ncbi:1-deoxy-D-xylulose-5-phosphate synthase [Nocardia huaxiensis]|uniref:1-deoxy-D-xylulose-5-phosphate synthase n=1 Tax=Nocardia huaxiensis TaxID=2755382 RepID=A0A7D6VID4_9NOCA|nr:1-deoxy-D-xylulose-5-phosphate synthase [Nocardia huaxiensis]QLY33575.1 1-deoxy-D-xylulose-5-phosphate synthase [Nocardia huaxiensis]
MSPATAVSNLLTRIQRPTDLRTLSAAELHCLAGEIRHFLIRKVTSTGGHLGPNLGVVELTLALHRVFDSPSDPIIFDTGHQAYVHKILTGRQDGFDTLRRRGGLSGYPARTESEHDWVESSHASTGLSCADGLAKAFALSGRSDRHVVAVVGDGALTGGVCWEALNNIAASPNQPVVIVLNDNGRSYAPTVGGLANRLTTLRSVPDAPGPHTLFPDLGIAYIGPVDGHDLPALESALVRAKESGGPVIVHAVTRKGMGYEPAENDERDRMHACGPLDPITGAPLESSRPEYPDWTDVFATELVNWGARRPDLVAVTAAMPGPTGVATFGDRFPERMFDVGIAEQHAVASAAGMALGGLHPVVAVYSTFLNRAFDQVLMDVALPGLPVTFVLDRSGVTGPDGASHNGVWDLSVLGMVPGMRVAAPRDAATLREEFAEALAVTDGPTALRFPKGATGPGIPAARRDGGVDVLRAAAHPEVLLIAVGPLAEQALIAAAALHERGIEALVVDPRWVLPVPPALAELAAGVRLVVTVEDSGVHGGFGSAVTARLRDDGVSASIRIAGVPQRFLEHGSRDEILRELELTGAGIATRVTTWLAEVTR